MKMASLSNKKEGMRLAEKYYDKYMAETLDKVISSYSEEHDLFIESLNIDLGKIRPDNIPFALEKALREQLDNLINKQEVEQNRRIEMQQNIEEITDFRNYSQLLFYLENGYYEYLQEKKNADSNRPSQIEMLNKCLANESGKQTLLSIIAKDKQALFRLTNIASKETLLKILDILIEEQISPISERRTIQKFKTFAKKQTNKKGVAYLIEELLFNSKSKTEENLSKEINSIESREKKSEFQEKNSKEKNKRSKEGKNSENPQEKTAKKHSGFEENRRKEEDNTKANNTLSKSSQTKDRVAELYDKASEESFNLSNQQSFNKHKRIHLHDAGLVLLSPFFTTLFKRLDYLDEKDDFKSLKERIRGVHILRAVVYGFEEEQEDNQLSLCKIICGMQPFIAIDDDFQFTEKEKDEVENMLQSVLKYWRPMKGTSNEGLRQAFLRRFGTIEKDEVGWIVRVEGQALDILLEVLPWTFSTITSPWSEFLIHVEWQEAF